ncbi:MAG: 4a-hydroxytetrahydrobiopterin dehydratase, partial [Schleiferiaceae bacterium]|nr:4a-hydroxytetrahydrobiopterin dehydratase [Schleiferiaceae bacterium]
MKKLTDAEIGKKLKSLPGWNFYDNALHTEFQFVNFKVCMSAMNRIA